MFLSLLQLYLCIESAIEELTLKIVMNELINQHTYEFSNIYINLMGCAPTNRKRTTVPSGQAHPVPEDSNSPKAKLKNSEAIIDKEVP